MIKHALRFRRHIATAASVTFLTLALAPAAHASGSSMPGKRRSSRSWNRSRDRSPRSSRS